MSVNNVVCVLGIKKARFDNEQGEQIKYARLFGSFPDKGVKGLSCAEFKILYSLADDLVDCINCNVSLSYNRFGKVIAYEVIEPEQGRRQDNEFDYPFGEED